MWNEAAFLSGVYNLLLKKLGCDNHASVHFHGQVSGLHVMHHDVSVPLRLEIDTMGLNINPHRAH